jgi:hypothetical protein
MSKEMVLRPGFDFKKDGRSRHQLAWEPHNWLDLVYFFYSDGDPENA